MRRQILQISRADAILFQMNEPREDQANKVEPVKLDERLNCDVCGRFGAIELGERRLCPGCYEGCGSCCPEFGRDETS
jgi:hypothetical protein